MDQNINFGEYTFSLLDENSLDDLKEVSETLTPTKQKRMFEWVLAKQKWYFLYIVRHNNIIIGRIEIKTVNHSIPFYEIGIEVKEKYRSLGHGEQMIGHTVDYLKTSCLAKRIQAVVNVDNKASNALFRKSALCKECTLKSYSVTVEHDPCDANIYSVIF